MRFLRRLTGDHARPADGVEGWATLPVAELNAMVEATLGPLLVAGGFEANGLRRWVRSTASPIRDVVQVVALKGRTYGVCWGHSLDYVPHFERDEVRWHRTVRSARIDLPTPTFGPPMRIPLLLVERPARVIEAIGDQVQPQILDWLEVPDGERSLVPKFEAASRELTWCGIYLHVAFAATLARLGDDERARTEFERFASRAVHPPASIERARAIVFATRPTPPDH